MVAKPEATMIDHLLAIEKENFDSSAHEGKVRFNLDFKLSAAALDEIKKLEQCSILAEHALGEFRVG